MASSYKVEQMQMEEKEAAQSTEMVENAIQQPDLPHDLVVHQNLTRLPIKSLIKFKSVSKLWYITLSSSQFANTHLKLSPFYNPISQNQFLLIQNKESYYLLSYNDAYDDDDCNNMNLVKLRFNFNDDDDLVLIGSCNGLVCLASFLGHFFILWNPITGKYCHYYDPNFVFIVEPSTNFRVSWGFGYVSSIDDYKVVRIIELNDTLEIRVDVFSLKSEKWERIDDGLFGDIFSLTTSKNMVIIYSGNDEPPIRFPCAFHSREGVLINETILDCVERSGFICELGGCLSKCGVSQYDDVFIAMLRGPGKVENLRLSIKWRLSLSSCRGIVGFTARGKFFIQMEDSTIGIVDPTSQPMKYTPLVTFESLGKSRVSSYIPSLISAYTTA